MGRRFTVRQRLRYVFDNTLSRGLWVVLLWLGLVAAAFFLVVAFIISLTGVGPGDERTSFGDGLWHALTRSLDPGTFSGDEGTNFRLVMLFVTLAGIFIAATIIGLVSSAIDSRIHELRRGRSLVVETGHTLIVGWSDKVPIIVSELVEANRSTRGHAIVVLSAEDAVEVTESIRDVVRDLGRSRLVVRTGAPTRIRDLEQGNPRDAKSVIVLHTGDESDPQVVKTVLALSRIFHGMQPPGVVAELADASTARALQEAVGPSLVTVTPLDVIARIGAQVSRAAGLGAVYQELLDFDGDELYVRPLPAAWAGRTFGELLLASSASTMVGLRGVDGHVDVAPSLDRLLIEGDEVIGISEDDSTFVLDRSPVDWRAAPSAPSAMVDRPREQTLIIGWSDLAPRIAAEIETHAGPGSQLHVLVDADVHDIDAVSSLPLTHQELVVHTGDLVDRASIERVMAEGPFDHVILLAERGRFSADEADARSLLALVHVQRIAQITPHSENVVAELLDPASVELGSLSDSDEFIVSQRLVSLLIAQLSENPHLAAVFSDLFDGVGAVVELHPVHRYVEPGATTFEEILRAARELGVIAIGYRVGGTVRVNPPKQESIALAEGDTVVVVSRV